MPRSDAQNSGAVRPKPKRVGKPFTGADDPRRNNGGVPQEVRELKEIAKADGPELWRLLMKGARKGNPHCVIRGLEYALGKPTQMLQVTGQDGKPVEVKATVKSDGQSDDRIAAVVDALARAGVLVVPGATGGSSAAGDATADEVHPTHATPDTGGVSPPR